MRQVDATRRGRRGRGPEHRVDVDRAAGGLLRLRTGVAHRIAAAAAELGAHAAREQAEARARVVFEAAPLDGIDGERQLGRRLAQQPRNLQQLGQCRGRRAGQHELRQRVERGLGRAGGPHQGRQQARDGTVRVLDRRRVLAVERVAERGGVMRIEPRLGKQRRHQGRRVEIDGETAFEPEPVERVGGQQDDLGIAGGAGADTDELEADLAELALGAQLAAAHAQDLAGVAQAQRPGAAREPRGRNPRDLRREIAAHGHHAVRGRVHQAEGLVGEPGAGAAQHALLEFDERRLDPLVALRREAGEQRSASAASAPASGGSRSRRPVGSRAGVLASVMAATLYSPGAGAETAGDTTWARKARTTA